VLLLQFFDLSGVQARVWLKTLWLRQSFKDASRHAKKKAPAGEEQRALLAGEGR
jgi:hypothetical protein